MALDVDAPFEYDPFAPAVMANPGPYYRVLRREAPAYYLDKYDTFFFSTHQGVRELLSIPNNVILAVETSLPTQERVSTTRHTSALPLASTDPMSTGNMLPSPYYEQMRQAHMAPFRPKAVAALEDFIRNLARERLKVLLPRKRFDLTKEYAGIVAASTILHIFGLPLDDAEELLNLVNELAAFDPKTNQINVTQGLERYRKYMVPAIEARRASKDAPGGLLLDGLLDYRLETTGRPLTDEEMIAQLTCAMTAASESVPKVTAHGILELSLRPDQLAAVRADLATNVPIAVKEIVRLCNPIQYSFRTVHEDVSIIGQEVKAGQRACALFYSANRDEREYQNAEEFIWNREIPELLTFGFGRHHCMGRHLAMAELRILITEFLSQVNAFHFEMDKAVREPSYFQWGWQSLPVVIDD